MIIQSLIEGKIEGSGLACEHDFPAREVFSVIIAVKGPVSRCLNSDRSNLECIYVHQAHVLALGVFGDKEDRTSQAYVIYRADIEKPVIN